MDLTLWNTKTKEYEAFEPIDANGVRMYTCGPTVYNTPHIGNYRAYIASDILKRTLIRLGYQVLHVMNVTDVEDKTIRDSQAAGMSLADFTERYTKQFVAELDELEILRPDVLPRATHHIPEIIAITEQLLQKGFAYQSDDGSVYFDVSKDTTYGVLSPVTIQKENAQKRMKADEYDKDSAQDFALWKAWDKADGDVAWDSPFGKGRPGWHIECSAMSMAHLGAHFDIHTGGVDLIFPHHENEIAQSTCATGHEFVNYWVHSEWLLVEGKKMSKSLKNFYRLEDIKAEGVSPLAYRLYALQAHYRSSLNFTWDGAKGAQNALMRLYDIFMDLDDAPAKPDIEYARRFDEALADDLDTPRALAVMWELVHDMGIAGATKRATLLSFDLVLGLGLASVMPDEVPDDIAAMLTEREEARQAKDWLEADRLRREISNKGWELRDTPRGQRVRRI